MEWIIIAGLVAALVLIGVITLKRRFTAMSINVGNAMSQIGVQLSSRYDTTTALLQLTQQYAGGDLRVSSEMMNFGHHAVTAESRPEDVMRQETVIADTLKAISTAARQYPALMENEEYARLLEAVEGYGKMLDISRLIYNDSVKKLNHNLDVFPANLVGTLLGFTRSEYLNAPA